MALALSLVAIAALQCFQLAGAQQVVFTVQPSNTSVEAGQPFSLSCRAVLVSSPTADVSYSWSRNGQEINATLSTLEFSSASDEAVGEYVCTVQVGGITANSNQAFVTVTQPVLSQREVNIIAISVSVGMLIIILVGVVLFAWCSLCLHKRHIWDKAPSRPRPQSDPLLMEEGAEDANTNAYSLTHTKRAKSLNYLYSSSSTALMEHATVDLSSEYLLTASRPTDITGLDDDRETLDFDLHLDEELFDQNPNAANRASSEGTLNDLSASKRSRQDGRLFKMASRRRASADSYSDVLSDHEQSSDALDDTGSSLFNKSVRFEVDELADSGIQTGSSTPGHIGALAVRRASEPEVKHTRVSQRRSSAPECNGSGLAENGSYNGSQDVANEDKVLVCIEDAIEDRNEDISSEKSVGSSAASDDATKKIARLISVAENWQSSEPHNTTPPATPSHSMTRNKVAEMRSKFLEREESFTDSVSEGQKATKRLSQLVSATTKLLLQEQSHEPPTPPASRHSMKLKEFTPKPSTSAEEEEEEAVGCLYDETEPVNCLHVEKGEDASPGDPAVESCDPEPDDTSTELDEQNAALCDPTGSSCDPTEEQQAISEEDKLMEDFFASRKPIMPMFSSPVGLSHWQPATLTPPPAAPGFDQDNDKEEEEEEEEDKLVEPLKLLTPGKGSTAVQLTPFGKSFLAPKAGPSETARTAMREIRRTLLASGGVEPLGYSQSYYRRKIATLSSIPEESPELVRSSHSLIQAQN